MPGITTKAGNVMRLNVPNTSRKPKTMLGVIEERSWLSVSTSQRRPKVLLTFSREILSIKTKLHSTSSVSTEFEKV